MRQCKHLKRNCSKYRMVDVSGQYHPARIFKKSIEVFEITLAFHSRSINKINNLELIIGLSGLLKVLRENKNVLYCHENSLHGHLFFKVFSRVASFLVQWNQLRLL